MKKLISLFALLAMFAFVFVVSATPPSEPKVPAAPGQNKIVCFQDGTGTCTPNSNGAKGSATLTVTGNVGDGDAGVYYLGFNDSIYNVLLSDVTMLSFTYTGTATGGAPRFSIPIDETNDGTTEAFAFAGAALCNDGAGLVDVINDPTCDINYNSVDYANWADFAAAYPDAVVSYADYVFVIADEPGTWTVNNVIIGKPGK